MSDNVYKTIEITGSSAVGPDDAVRLAIEKASVTIKNLRWFKVVETRGNIEVESLGEIAGLGIGRDVHHPKVGLAVRLHRAAADGSDESKLFSIRADSEAGGVHVKSCEPGRFATGSCN